MEINDITGAIIDASMKIHTALGPGLLEHVYRKCLAHDLRKRDLVVAEEIPLPVVYDGVSIDLAYRLDLMIEDAVVVELKSVERTIPLHKAQLLSYLKLTGKQVGLLINFNSVHLRDGIVRVVNHYSPISSAYSASSAV
jgi:GxxExxY protein